MEDLGLSEIPQRPFSHHVRSNPRCTSAILNRVSLDHYLSLEAREYSRKKGSPFPGLSFEWYRAPQREFMSESRKESGRSFGATPRKPSRNGCVSKPDEAIRTRPYQDQGSITRFYYNQKTMLRKTTLETRLCVQLLQKVSLYGSSHF